MKDIPTPTPCSSETLGPTTFRMACRRIADEELTLGERLAASWQLHDALIDFTDLKSLPGATVECTLPEGAAISARDAAHCLREYLRTGRFMIGLSLAVAEARTRFPGERIHVLDAGCGPFALLALSLTAWYSSDEVGFTLLEHQPDVLELARRVVLATGSEDYLVDSICADATRYRCPSDKKPHIMVTETMASALRREPQVAIANNLAQQLVPGGLMVPEVIEVDLALLGTISTEGHSPPCWRAPVLRLDAESARSGLVCKPAQVPVAQPGERFQLLTWIQVFGSSTLDLGECSLTLPVPLLGGEALRGGEELHFSYRGGRHPGIYREGYGFAFRRPHGTAEH